MIGDPLKQFKINSLFDISFGSLELPFTNSAMAMLIVASLVLLLFMLSSFGRNATPNRVQAMAEILYDMAAQKVNSTTGKSGKRYIPFIFTLFLFILGCNLLGMIPFSFTVTSHVAVTFGLAMFIFVAITVVGFVKHGAHYLKLFLPDGVPIVVAPLLVVIEFFSYLTRPVSLSIRLAANMTAGHIVLKVLASFTVMAGFLGIFPLALLVLLTGFEIFVAVLQAYIFSILTCVYLNDALNLH